MLTKEAVFHWTRGPILLVPWLQSFHEHEAGGLSRDARVYILQLPCALFPPTEEADPAVLI